MTRAGCDVGAFSPGNGLAIENKTDNHKHLWLSSRGRPESGSRHPQKLGKELRRRGGSLREGQSSRCAAPTISFAKPDLLPDEPGSYSGFSALYGNINVSAGILARGPVG